MPGIRPRKLLKLRLGIEMWLGRLCPTNGQCRHAGAYSLSLENQGLDGRFEDQGSQARFPELPHLSSGIVNTTDVQLAHLVLERCSFESEAFCRSTLAGYSSGCSSQRIDDDLPLGLFET